MLLLINLLFRIVPVVVDQINFYLKASEYRMQWERNFSQYRSSFADTVTYSYCTDIRNYHALT